MKVKVRLRDPNTLRMKGMNVEERDLLWIEELYKRIKESGDIH